MGLIHVPVGRLREVLEASFDWKEVFKFEFKVEVLDEPPKFRLQETCQMPPDLYTCIILICPV